MDKGVLWIGGITISIILALIWRLYDMDAARDRWAEETVISLRTAIAAGDSKLADARHFHQREHGVLQEKVSDLEKEIARLEQRQGRDEDRWERLLKSAPTQRTPWEQPAR